MTKIQLVILTILLASFSNNELLASGKNSPEKTKASKNKKIEVRSAHKLSPTTVNFDEADALFGKRTAIIKKKPLEAKNSTINKTIKSNKEPMPAGPIPIPYPNIGMASDKPKVKAIKKKRVISINNRKIPNKNKLKEIKPK